MRNRLVNLADKHTHNRIDNILVVNSQETSSCLLILKISERHRFLHTNVLYVVFSTLFIYSLYGKF